jgi:hypothetical protein
MAVYKIFPEKSATLYSYYPTLNSGLDEILELSNYKTIEGYYEISRPIIKFSNSEISDVLNLISSSNYDVYLKLSLANCSQIPLNYTLYCHPLALDWNVGTGRASNVPITTDGVSWLYTNNISGSNWFTSSSFPTGTTGSFKSGSNAGGGLWYTGSNYISSQSFNHVSPLDINIKVTNIFNAWSGSTIPNYGLILKHSSSIEFSSSSIFETKYFSGNTHTIYPPCLEIRWNDFSYNTGSLSTINSSDIVVSLGNNKKEFQQGSIQRFRVNVRDKFPVRLFQTSSVYLNNKILPTSSYWSIKDLDTEEIIVDYDDNYTKISTDSEGNFFDVYFNGLEPERYFQILIKTTISGSTIILDDNYYFKVIR